MDLNLTNLVDLSILEQSSEKNAVLIVLNRPINKQQFQLLRSKSKFVICADGAANRLFDISHE